MKIGMRLWPLLLAFLWAGMLAAQEDSTNQQGSLNFSDLPQFTYGNGLGITSPDSLYQLNIRFRMMNRISFNMTDGDVTDIEARVRRVRLRFDGYVYSPKIGYALQLAFAAEDINDFVGVAPNVLRDAVIYLRPTDNFTIFFGQTKLPGNRQRVNSSGDLQLCDRSALNAIFNIDRDFGLQFHYTNEIFGDAVYALKGAISTGEGRNWTKSPGAHLAYTGRIEFLPFGNFTNRGDYYEGDLSREETPKLSLGAVLHYNEDALRTAGQRGQELYQAKDIQNRFFDFVFKYRGFSLNGEVARKRANDPLSFNPDDTTQVRFVYNGHGYFLQSSYLFMNNFEIVGRYEHITADRSIQEYVVEHSRFITAGINKYVRGHRLKFQIDATYLTQQAFDSPSTTGSWQFRFQMELGI